MGLLGIFTTAGWTPLENIRFSANVQRPWKLPPPFQAFHPLFEGWRFPSVIFSPEAPVAGAYGAEDSPFGHAPLEGQGKPTIRKNFFQVTKNG